MTQPLGTIRQLAYVVEDMEVALDYWINTLGVGPFFSIEHARLENQKYYGEPGNADVSIALGNSGDLQIELIHQHNDAPSVYRDFLQAGRTGVHHFGLMPLIYGEAFKKYQNLGHQVAFECSVGGAPVVYFDTLDTVGHYIELWDNNSVFKDLFLMVEQAAIDWQGEDPVRSLAL
jgi:hypothetical protein